MAEMQLEALVGHIYIVGGRAIGSSPPGSRISIAPKRAPRPRQEETVFVLAVPNGPIKSQAHFYEELAKQAIDHYFKTTSSITSGLRETLNQLNSFLLEQQKTLQQPVRAGVIFAVMRDEEVYVGRSGPLLAFHWDQGILTSFPKERTRELLSISPPLGASMEARVELARFDLKAGALLVLADDSLLEVEAASLGDALAVNDIESVLDPLRKLITTPFAHATLIQFVTEDTPTPAQPIVKRDSPTPSALPVLLPSTGPLALAPASESAISIPASESLPIPSTPPISAEVLPTTNAEVVLVSPPPPIPTTLQASEPTVIIEPPTSAASVIVEETELHPAPRRTTGVLKVVAKTLSGVADTTTKLGERIAPETATPAPATLPFSAKYPFLANLLFLLAIIIPMIIGVVVVGLALSPSGQTNFELCRADVLALQEAARQLTPLEGGSLDDAKAQEARQQWAVVKTEALLCEAEKPGDQELLLIGGEAQNNLDRFDRAVRRDLQPLRRFREGGDLRGPVSGNWIDLYTLDIVNDEVYRDILSTDGVTLVTASESPIIFKGQSIGNDVVGDLIDIVWMMRGGLPAGTSNVALTMDSNGLLIWQSESINENEAIRLVKPPTWGTPVAITMWQLNFYVLDPQAQQIWRYRPNEGLYSEVPEEYFTGVGDVRPDLSQAVDFGIDEDGNLFVLFRDGEIKKFRGGESAPFDLYNVPQGALNSGVSLFVDNNPISRGIVVTDPQSQTIYTMSLGGTINVGYRPRNQQNAFERLSGALVNADTNSIYAVAGNYLYYLPRQ